MTSPDPDSADPDSVDKASAPTGSSVRGAERKKVLVRLDPAVHAALVRWANDDLRSTNAQIEFALRLALRQAGRL